nr:MAG TPA: Protein arginine N-methyltransferase 3 zinc finger domain, protein [Caudoviricetes sp.]
MSVFFSIRFFGRQQCNPALSNFLPQKVRLINYFRRIP